MRPWIPSAAALLVIPLLPATSAPAPAQESREELAGIVETIQTPLEELRGLSFKSPLESREVDRETARRHLERILLDEYPDGELQAEEAALRFLGLLDGPAALKGLLLDLLESQVAGFYDPAAKRLYVVPGPLAGSLATAHEMAHALADQHFDLEGLKARAEGNEDRELALAALVEGEATMVTYLWGLRSAMDPDMPSLTSGDPAELLEQAARGLDQVPPFVKESLIFPYLRGGVWAAEVMKRGGGLKALNPYFLEPPESTEQILHPEKSLTPRDRPSIIDPSLVAGSLPEGVPVLKADTMGEFGIQLLLGGSSVEEAVRAAAGWDADRYVLAGTGGARHLTWVSVWDTVEEAGEFREALEGWFGRRARLSGGSHRVEAAGAVVVAAEGDAGDGMDAPARVARILSALPDGITAR